MANAQIIDFGQWSTLAWIGTHQIILQLFTFNVGHLGKQQSPEQNCNMPKKLTKYVIPNQMVKFPQILDRSKILRYLDG